MLGSEEICLRHASKYCPLHEDTMVAFAATTIGQNPIYGVRLEADAGKIEWFIWCGEHNERVDFYAPYHARHMRELFPIVIPYLSLEPGYKFIIDDAGYEDVWRESHHPS